MKIAVLDWDTVSSNGDILPFDICRLGDVKLFGLTKPEETADNIGDAEIVLCNKVLITREIMEKCPNMRYIGLFATGYNNVDIAAATEHGITVCNAGQYSTNGVAQLVFAYILDYCSRVRHYNSAVQRGEWETSPCFSYFPIPTYELSGKTLSIVGYGSIGKRVAEIGHAFGMDIIISTRTDPTECLYEVADLDTAVRKADFLTFHCPLTESTRGMVNAELLDKMKSTAVLINTSRGGVVNEADLTNALIKGTIAAAYLDVMEREPMDPHSPLKGIEQCVITPHTAWAAYETRCRLLDIVCTNVRAWLDGKPTNVVN